MPNRYESLSKRFKHFQARFNEIPYSSHYLLGPDYAGYNRKMTVTHLICNHSYKVTPAHLIEGRKCPYCGQRNRNLHGSLSTIKRRTQKFLLKFNKLPWSNEYKILTPYTNETTKVKVWHKICNHSWWVTPNNLVRGARCPYCYHTSRMEVAFQKLLENYSSIKFIHGYLLPMYKNKKRCLHADFFIKSPIRIDGNKYQNTVVECDGPQHFGPINFFGGWHKYLWRINSDAVKNNYCFLHHIYVIRIPFNFALKSEKEAVKVALPYFKKLLRGVYNAQK